MRRFDLFTVALLAALTAACGGGSGEISSPTAPSQTSTTTTAPPAPTPGCSRPPAPGNLTVSGSGSQLTFNWSPSNGADQYFFMIGTQPSSSNVMYTNTTQTNFNWNGGSRGTYYVRVAANNSCGDSSPSNEVVVVIPN